MSAHAPAMRDLRGNVWTQRDDGWWEADGKAPRSTVPGGSVPA